MGTRCSLCGSDTKPGADRCDQCGTPIGASAPGFVLTDSTSASGAFAQTAPSQSAPTPTPAWPPVGGSGAARVQSGRVSRTEPRTLLLMAGVVVLGILVVLLTWRILSTGSPESGTSVAVQATQGSRSSALSPSPVPGTPNDGHLLQPPAEGRGTIAVVAGAPGDACIPSWRTAWGEYPVAVCKVWQPAVGLTTGAYLGKTDAQSVACQSDLGQPNPNYAAGQSNTWWVWTRADDGTWDWFPETAIAQGSSGRPINGIAVCGSS